jgi:biopolymer transport protein ExbB
VNALDLLTAGDAIHRLVVWVLLAMSVASWVVILYKLVLVRRAGRDVLRGTAAFWQAPSLDGAAERVAAFDRSGLLRPLLAAMQSPPAGTLAGSGPRSQQLTRLLRGALQQSTQRLQFGQVLLATVGATAPFVGLLGTVWGIYNALTSISAAGQITVSQISGPVGEALVMTAAGLAVAIPAVLAYNWFGRSIARLEAELEGFAFDLRDLLAPER